MATSTDNTIQIKAIDFEENILSIECDFLGISGSNTLKLNLSTDIELSFTESAEHYAYDDNKIEAYRNEHYTDTPLGIPWNFIESGKFDILKAKVNRKKAFSVVNSIESNDNSLNISPTEMSSNKEDITFDFLGNGHNVIEVSGCSDDPELLIYTAPKKMYHMEFWGLCDTDDDCQVLPFDGMGVSETDVCIAPGADGTIDGGVHNVRKGDDVKSGHYILVGPNLKCESKIHKADENDECPNPFDINPFFEFTKAFYKKIGLEFMNNGFMGVKKLNYHTVAEDDVLSKSEQTSILTRLVGVSVPHTDGIIRVYLVKNLGGSINEGSIVQGRSDFGSNIIMLSTSAPIDARILSHECGHGMWRLIHPGEPYIGNNHGEFQINDHHNFMHGVSDEVKSWNIRRYQFGLIHEH